MTPSRVLRARCVWLDDGRTLSPGEIAWDAGGRITSLRRCRGRVADACVLPGLVNAHAHVQIDALPHREGSFVPWVAAVMAARASDTAVAERERIAAAARELLASGTTAVGDIDATGRGLSGLAATPLTGRSYRELTGFHLEGAAARRLVRERRQRAEGAVRPGLSPHAPYSVSADLFAAARDARQHLAIHCAETPEEQQFLHTGRGPFADLLARLGRLPERFRPPRMGAVRWLEHLGVLGPRTQLVHCQELERGDVARIASAGASIVVCPGTIAWFGRQPPPVPAWLAAGIPVALGTDSRASNTGLSLRAELRLAATMWPDLDPAQLLAMATRSGGAALGMSGLGRLRRGGRADFVVVRAADPATAVAAFVAGRAPIAAVVAGGRQIVVKSFRR